jgi:hypothetical protein
MDPVPPLRVEDRFTGVRRVSDALHAAGIRHALGGGALRWSLGLAQSVRDWDLTTDASEGEASAALAPFALQRVITKPPYASAFCFRLQVEGEYIDLIGSFAITTAEGPMRIPTRVAAWAHGVPWAEADDWAHAYRALGRNEEAAGLVEYAARADRNTLRAPDAPDASPTPDLLADIAGGNGNWPGCAATWRSAITEALYGPLPPEPERLEVTLAAQARVTRLPGSPFLSTFRARATVKGVAVPYALQLLRPDRPDPTPVVLTGDAGWWAPSDEAVGELLARGVALAQLDRTEVAFDIAEGRPRGPLPEAVGDRDAGAIAHWAWALRRGLDLLEQLSSIDPQRMALSGFSRGGKAALLAGAGDARARVVHAHASGAGGAASSRCTPAGAERLLDVVSRFPSWFAPGALALAADPHALPFDQHALIAAIAPRQVLLTCGLGDRWANPHGTARTVAAAAPAFALSGQPEALLWRVRPGGHTLEGADWRLLARALQATAVAPRDP